MNAVLPLRSFIKSLPYCHPGAERRISGWGWVFTSSVCFADTFSKHRYVTTRLSWFGEGFL
jgi:hypothetical protein